MKRNKKVKIIRVIAKIWSIISILFLLGSIFVFIFSPSDGDEAFSTVELIAFAFFPVGVLVGLILSWKKEILGAIISLGCMFIFYLLIIVPRGAWRAISFTFILILPSILFIINHIYKKVL